MQIAFVDVFQNLPANSGNDWYSLCLVSDLQEIGEVSLYHTQQENGKRGYMPPDRVIEQKLLAPSVKWWRISRRLDQLRPEILFDRSTVEAIEADLVLARLYSYHIARHIAKNNEAPIIIVMHNIEWQYLKHAGYTPLIYAPARLYENFVLRKAAAVTALSLKDLAYATTTTSVEKVFFVPHKPNAQIYNSNTTSYYDYRTDRLNVLFYGSLDRQHNVKALEFIKLKLIPEIKARGLFHSIQIQIFGSGEPPKRLDLENDPEINFFGWVENPALYIRGADVVIVPVRNSSGVKVRILEAFACNKPVIAFPEAVVGLENQYSEAITIANNAKGFVEGLKSLLQTAPYRNGKRFVNSSARVSTACDAARFALEKKGDKKMVRERRYTRHVK